MQSPNPTTSYSLIDRIQSLNLVERHQGLTVFAVRYYPFIKSQVRKYYESLNKQDRENICQHVLKRACEDLIQKYDRRKGGFRSWFATVIINESLAAIRSLNTGRVQRADTSVLANMLAADPSEEHVKQDCHQFVLNAIRDFVDSRAVREGDRSKWRVFALVYMQRLEPANFDLTRVLREVAELTGKTVNAVSIDCCRVRAVLQEEFGDALED